MVRLGAAERRSRVKDGRTFETKVLAGATCDIGRDTGMPSARFNSVSAALTRVAAALRLSRATSISTCTISGVAARAITIASRTARASGVIRGRPSAVDDIDIVDLLPRVTMPTIVFHCIHDRLVPFDQGRRLAASIQNARFVALDSENHALLSDDPAWAHFVSEMKAFLSDET